MNMRWLSLFILLSLLLILGGVRHTSAPAATDDDPVQRTAKTVVADSAKGSAESWQNAARQNPQWLIEIVAR